MALRCWLMAPLRSRSDRKSTRLNSSHLGISYAVFCLKKKNTVSVRVSLAVEQTAGTLPPRPCTQPRDAGAGLAHSPHYHTLQHGGRHHGTHDVLTGLT